MRKSIDIRSQDLMIVQTILHSNLPRDAKIWVFGSRAHGKARRGSDLDLAIDLGRPFTKKESNELFYAFEESDLPYKVDVVDLYSITDSFKKIIDEQKIEFPS